MITVKRQYRIGRPIGEEVATIRGAQSMAEPTETVVEFDDPLDALALLAEDMVGMRGRIIAFGENRIEVDTGLIDGIDVSIFEGKHMEPLLMFVYFFLRDSNCRDNATVPRIVKDVNGFMDKGLGGIPALIASLYRDETVIRAKMAVMLTCGVHNERDIGAGLSGFVSIADIVAAWQLSKEGLCSFREAFALTRPYR